MGVWSSIELQWHDLIHQGSVMQCSNFSKTIVGPPNKSTGHSNQTSWNNNFLNIDGPAQKLEDQA